MYQRRNNEGKYKVFKIGWLIQHYIAKQCHTEKNIYREIKF